MFKSAGCQSPIYAGGRHRGDIFVQVFSGGKGHTGFVVDVYKDGKSIYTGEGNCANRLKIGLRKISSISHFIGIGCFRDDQTRGFSRSKFDV